MRFGKFGALALAAGFCAQAQAGTITQTGTVPLNKTDYSTLFSVSGGANGTTFAGFNAALGTLNDVQVSYTVSGAETGNLMNASASTQTFIFQSNSNLSVADAGSSAPSSLTNYLSTGLTLDGTSTRYTLAGGQSTSIALTNGNGFSPASLSESSDFTGASAAQFIGTNFSLDLDTLSGSSFTGGGGNITTALNTSDGGMLSIIYNYTAIPTGVSEPATFTILFVGLLGLSIMRARKQI